MRVIIAGSRHIHDRNVLNEALRSCPFLDQIETVFSGGCKGVDRLGEEWARENSKKLVIVRAKWNENGKAAGPLRNSIMAQSADALIAIPNPDGPSRGTDDMIKKALRYGLRVHVHRVSS
jgi:hypothetical protein